SATRADRLADLTELNVATASTSVPPAVASEEIVTQSAMDRPVCTQTFSEGARRLSRRRRSLDLLHVDGLGALGAGLLLVGHLGALRERPVAVGLDARVVDEEVAIAVIGRDEAKPLLVAEPLDCSGWHGSSPPLLEVLL